jgi:hypothetical protein
LFSFTLFSKFAENIIHEPHICDEHSSHHKEKLDQARRESGFG